MTTALVVDDSRMSRMMLRTIIQTHRPDWQIVEAESGEQAIALTTQTPVQIITLDMNMPGMDGISTGMVLRERFPDASIALITANVQASVRQRAAAAQIRFIPKPISEERIASYLAAMG